MNKYNNQVYELYEEETKKNLELSDKVKSLKLENAVLKQDLKQINKSFDNKVNSLVKKLTSSFIMENNELKNELKKAYNEIDRLKKQINNNEDNAYIIDKLNNQVSKDSTNSSIPTSKELISKNKKTGANTYNHRVKSNKKTGGQPNHKGTTLTKQQLEDKIKDNNLEVREIVHYINGSLVKQDVVKYKIGMEVKTYVEKHIFKSTPNSSEKLPRSFYSDVTYNNDIKANIISLGNYFNVPYNKINEFLYDLTDGIINISEGTIDNIYDDFDSKLDDTLNNITSNLLNGSYQHTDETTTKENGKSTYYRGYANKYNVIYMYHNHKGDAPIIEDGILNKYFGTIISDHDVCIFKYGTNNQDCIIHLGRYCIEKIQNINNISWPIDLYRLLLKFEINRQILKKYGRKEFTKEELIQMEKEYDEILSRAKEENEKITSKYWKEKTNTLLNRCIKHKNVNLFYLHDFDIPYDNNFIERALRMIKSKTKVSGGFRSEKGGKRFGRIMSIIKTAKLRNLNPFECIKSILKGQALFA